MKGKYTSIIAGLLVLIVGLALGFGLATLLGGDKGAAVALQVGDQAPEFELYDSTGGLVALSDFRGKKNVVLAFYPAAWTPVWTVQIPSYEADLERFEEANAQVLGISVDSTFTNAEWAKSLGVENVPLLSDFFPHGEVAQAYGVLGDAGYAERVIFIIDQEGIIRYVDVNEIDELPDNEVIFEELAKLR